MCSVLENDKFYQQSLWGGHLHVSESIPQKYCHHIIFNFILETYMLLQEKDTEDCSDCSWKLSST